MSGKYQIIYWRDIPSQIKAKVGRKRVSRPLSDRFMQIIDAAAMEITVDVSEDELAERRKAWKRPASDIRTGVLAKYRNEVSSASEGAVTIPPAWE